MPEEMPCKELCNKTLACFVIAICIVAMLICGATWFYKSYVDTPSITKVDIKFTTSDSLLTKNYITHEELDSLLHEINRQESQLSDKYQYFIEQKYNEDKYYSTIAVILGVVFSLFGFFGYKSVTSIEEKSIEKAQERADQTAKDYCDKYVRRYVRIESKNLFESDASAILQEKVTDNLNAVVDKKTAELEKELNKNTEDAYKDLKARLNDLIDVRFNENNKSIKQNSDGGNDSQKEKKERMNNNEDVQSSYQLF